MSKLPKKCLPFYKILKKDKSSRWSEDCENAFTKLKEYLSFLPILSRLEDEETLFIYITTSDEAVGTMLIVERNSEQRLVYFTNKVLHGTKVRH